MALIRYVGHDFTVVVPAEWARVATPRHLVVFIGREVGWVRSSMAVSRLTLPPRDAARFAAADHIRRFDGFELLDESVKSTAVYRRYRREHPGGERLMEHQLFGSGLLLTCSRVDRPETTGDEDCFGIALRTFGAAPRPET